MVSKLKSGISNRNIQKGLIKILLEKIKNLILQPSKFFESVKDESIEEGLKYLILSPIPLLIELLLVILILEITMPDIYINLPFFLILFPPALYISLISGVTINSIIVHIGVWIVGGKNSIEQTFKAVLYSNIFTLISSTFIIPFFVAIIYSPTNEIAIFILIILTILTLCFQIYSLYILLKGISILHRISTIRSLLAIIIPIIILFVLLFSLIFLFLLFFIPII